MTTREERHALIEIAQGVAAELSRFNLTVNTLVNRVISEADALALTAASEIVEEKTVKKLKFTEAHARADQEPVLDEHPTGVTTLPAGEGRTRKRRACSICREYGHYAKNCPKADKAYKAQRGRKK